MGALITSARPTKLQLPYRWNDVDGIVKAQIGVNDDPSVFGGEEFARGFPFFRATIEPEAVGYREMIGWVQVVERSDEDGGFKIDLFEPLGDVPHPFCFFGYSPIMFDSPHATYKDWDFTAHTFLCGLGGKLLEQTEEGRREVMAVLGFEWGFSKRGEKIDSFGLRALAADDWNAHLPYLHERFSEPPWNFLPGFFDHPLS
ncbi:MAG: hypothetical protein E6G51_02250 [Actinobacteria bacterium]|nr:MAG: hypothetical protein E6G51_02250 [Actinomycetota bacterium]